MIQLNKINSSYYGKVHIEVGKHFDLNSEFFNKKFFNTSIVDINIFDRTIKESVNYKTR